MENKHHSSKQYTIWLVGGGTGGHILPLISVAEILSRHPHIKLQYLGDRRGPEHSIAKQAGLSFQHVPNGKIRRYISPKAILLNIRDLFLIGYGIIIAIRLIRKDQPNTIFSKGGPGALPVAIGAYFTRTPLITHESDAVIGATNRIISLFAETVLTAFPADVYPASYARKIVSVGLPIRREFCRPHQNQRLRRPMILITGGSQGSHAINLLVASLLPDLLSWASVTHICGAQSLQKMEDVKQSLPQVLADHYAVLDFTPDIASYMHEASLVVTRASSTIFEIATLKKPMILIPLPGSANDHQMKNAEIFLRHKAALVLNQNNLTPHLLYETIQAVLYDRKIMSELVEGTRHFSCCGSADHVATLVLQSAMQEREPGRRK